MQREDSLESKNSGAGHTASAGRSTKLRLDQFLKLRGLVFTGGEAKIRIQSGEVTVNGEVETRRGLGLKPGDQVSIGEMEIEVGAELFEDGPPLPQRAESEE